MRFCDKFYPFGPICEKIFMNSLDKLDRDILNALQQDATIPLKELAVNVNSSIATCQREFNF